MSKTSLFCMFLSLIIVLGFFNGCSKIFFEKGFPTYSGDILYNSVKEPVEIYRDAYGIPHIYAKNEPDLYFAQGYVHAQDRLWQMEQNRRLIHGTLSEILGKETIEVDLFMRLLGMDKVLERMSKNTPAQLITIGRVYIDGINTYIEERKDDLPLEFSSLNFEPEPFTEEDKFVSLLINSWFLNRNYSNELFAVKVMNQLPLSAFDDLFPSHPDAQLPSDDYFDDIRSLEIAPFLTAVEASRVVLRGTSGASGGSNNWVVNGERSVSGLPLIANDPHLGQSVPGVWYFNHLNAPGTHAAGASIAGSPGVVIGHNEKVAWAITNLATDYFDLYVIKVDPENPTQYFVDGDTLEMEQEEITIQVKDSEAVHRTIYRTIHGPIITQIGKGEAQIALKWHQHTDDQTFKGFYEIYHANTAAEALEAGKHIGVFSINLLAADNAGNIGWHATGKVPIRNGYSGRLPADGSRSDFRWKGFIPYNELPSTLNPSEGIIVTANNRRIDDDYPYDISYSWAAPYRAQRITQLLNKKSKLSPEDFQRIQMDYHSLQAEKLISQMDALNPKKEEARWALEALRNWDFKVIGKSREAAIFEIFLTELIKNLLEDEIGDALNYYYDCLPFSYTMLDEILSKPNSMLWDRINTSKQETREEIVEESLADAVKRLKEMLGENKEDWQWEKIHKLSYLHPGSTTGMAKRYMNLGPYPIGGDNNTVNIGGFNRVNGYHMNYIASMRMIVDMNNVDKCLIIGPMGQSGQPQHQHYSDMIDLWRNGAYVPFYFSKDDVIANHKAKLVLKP